VDAAVGAGAGVRVGVSGGRLSVLDVGVDVRARSAPKRLLWLGYLGHPFLVTPLSPPTPLVARATWGCQGGNNEAPRGDKRDQGGDQGVPES
jgi:hypothetical protein